MIYIYCDNGDIVIVSVMADRMCKYCTINPSNITMEGVIRLKHVNNKKTDSKLKFSIVVYKCRLAKKARITKLVITKQQLSKQIVSNPMCVLASFLFVPCF